MPRPISAGVPPSSALPSEMNGSDTPNSDSTKPISMTTIRPTVATVSAIWKVWPPRRMRAL